MKKAPGVESLFLATHHPNPEAMLFNENMRTIPQQPMTAKKLRLELNGGPDSPLTCGRSRANDCRERIDPSTSLATALRLGGLQPRQPKLPFDVMAGSVGDTPKAEEAMGNSRVARSCDRVHRPDVLHALE